MIGATAVARMSVFRSEGKFQIRNSKHLLTVNALLARILWNPIHKIPNSDSCEFAQFLRIFSPIIVTPKWKWRARSQIYHKTKHLQSQQKSHQEPKTPPVRMSGPKSHHKSKEIKVYKPKTTCLLHNIGEYLSTVSSCIISFHSAWLVYSRTCHV